MQTQDKPQVSETPTVGAPSAQAAAKVKPVRAVPFWASLSVALNGLLLLAVSIGYWKPDLVGLSGPVPIAPEAAVEVPVAATPQTRSLPYEQWLDILDKEAKAVAAKQPDRLTLLLGDSLTLWFPPELLAGNRSWLNQGISGENTSGLLKRLDLLNDLKPQTILVMVGVNDLIKGNADETVVANYQKLMDELKARHPKAEVVIQSILPHGGDRLTVDDREQVLQVSNERIVQLNRQLRELATQREVKFLDLHAVFVDREGLLRSDLSTDGLHLSPQGYAAWQSALQVFDQLELQQPPVAAKADAAKPDEPNPVAADAVPVEAESAPKAAVELPPEVPKAEAAPTVTPAQ